MPSAVEVGVVGRTGPDLDALVPEWDALARRRGRGFACRPSYCLSWWTELGAGRLEVVTARRDGRLVAVAPLHRRSILGRPVLRWLGHGLGAVAELVAEDEPAARAVWEWLAARDIPLHLAPVRLDDVGTLALRRTPQLQLELEVGGRCPVLDLQAGEGAADVRGARTLKRLAGYRGALAREGRPFALLLVTDAEQLRHRWPDVVRVTGAAARGRAGLDLSAPPYAGFTLGFLEQEARAGGLVVAGALVGGRWAGHAVLLRTGASLGLWLLRSDPELGRYGLGHLLLEQLVDGHDELGVDRLDLGIGESSVTSAWSRAAYDVATAAAAPRHVGLLETRLRLADRGAAALRRLRTPAWTAPR